MRPIPSFQSLELTLFAGMVISTSPFASADEAPWRSTTVDSAATDGPFTSLAFGPDGNPAIAYVDWSEGMRLAQFDGTNWNAVTVSADSGPRPALAYGPEGTPAIAWGGYSLVFARFNGRIWNLEQIDGFQNEDYDRTDFIEPSLAFGPDGQPAISYTAEDRSVRLVRFNGTIWSSTVIGTGLGPSLAFGPDGQPAVAYLTTGSLRFARFDGAAWNDVTVDSGAAEGQVGYTSLAFGPDGQPAIAYSWLRGDLDLDPGLRCARFDGENWNIATVEAGAGASGWPPSLAFGPDGSPAIAYGTNDGVRLATFDGATWLSVPIDSTDGRYPSLAFGPDGQPAISYRDYLGEPSGLRFAQRGVATRKNEDQLPWRLTTVETLRGGGRASLIFGPDGQPALAYDEFTAPTHQGQRFARFDGTIWNTVFVDPPSASSGVLALAPDGQFALAYAKDYELLFARFNGTIWEPPAAIHWEWPEMGWSLAFGSNARPAIAFEYPTVDGGGAYALGFARFNDTGWTVATLDPDWGGYPSLAFGPDGEPAISYAGTDGLLRIARFNGSRLSIAVTSTDAGYVSSLAFGPDGQPAIAYGSSAGDLRFARFDGATWNATTIDHGDVDAPSLVFGPGGRPAIAYTGSGGLRFAQYDGTNWDLATIDPTGGGNPSLAIGPDGQPAIGYRGVSQTYRWNFDGTVRFAQRYIPPSVPAELVGPAGPDATTYAGGADEITYRVNFEHLPAASAPAQVVEIRVPLPAQLDPASVAFTSVGFGDVHVNVPPSATLPFMHAVPMSSADVNFDARIALSVDAASRELRARIASIVPATGQPPPAHIGFLPPEDLTGRGRGHLAYTVRPSVGLATGTEIRTTGFVTFDPAAAGTTFRTDLSVPTNPDSASDPDRQALVVLDVEPPSSRVLPLVWLMGGRSFTVSWEGNESAATATTFDIHVRTDHGAWTLWQSNTAATAAVWTGELGHTYQFVSVARDGVGNVESDVTAATAPDAHTTVAAIPGRLLNLSTRARCGTGPDVTISGFVISGTATKRLLIRAIGPTLADFGVFGVLGNPEMALWERVTEIYSEERGGNDNWSTNANRTEIMAASEALGAFGLAPDSGDSALLVDLSPGAYTVVARGVADTTGMVLVEVYDADDTLNTTQAAGPADASSQLSNISTRGYSGAGEEVMIPGFVVSPEGAQTILVRVVGPTLGDFGLVGVLSDPKLTIFDSGNTEVAGNDNWNDAPDADYTGEIGLRVGAFPLASGSADAALVATLPPGSYTVVCGSADGTGTGVVLAEVFLVE